jgi:hypothetical protein
MARTLKELERQVDVLQDEVAALKQERAVGDHPIRKLAGSLGETEGLKQILDDLERDRSQPDPELRDRR